MNEEHPAIDREDDRAREEAASVARYLRAHPDFLQRHPEVLSVLELAHDSGGAVSLLERQVGALRQQNHALRQRLRELVDTARTNGQLSARLHALTASLIALPALDRFWQVLREGLVGTFDVERSALLVFADAPPDCALPELFRGGSGAPREAFEAALAQGRPVCGRLRRQQFESAFGADAELGSGVILPLVGSGWQGVLVIAAADPRRYSADMATDLLVSLGEVSARLMDRWLAA